MNDDKGGGEAAHRTARRVTMMTEITTPFNEGNNGGHPRGGLDLYGIWRSWASGERALMPLIIGKNRRERNKKVQEL